MNKGGTSSGRNPRQHNNQAGGEAGGRTQDGGRPRDAGRRQDNRNGGRNNGGDRNRQGRDRGKEYGQNGQNGQSSQGGQNGQNGRNDNRNRRDGVEQGQANRDRGRAPQRSPYADLRTPIPSETGRMVEGIDPFALFCSYILGIREDQSYAQPSLKDTAHRLGTSFSSLKRALFVYALNYEQILAAGFDLEMARLDIRVAPVGIDKFEIAKESYKELRELLPMPEQTLKPAGRAYASGELELLPEGEESGESVL